MIFIIIKIIVYNVYVLFKVSQVKLFHVDIEQLFCCLKSKEPIKFIRLSSFLKVLWV